MKKLKYLSLLFLLILITGCGSKDGTKVLEDALENMKNVESGTIGVEMDVSMDGYAISMDMTTDFNKEGESYSKTTSTILGFSFSSSTYTVINEDNMYIYSTEDGEAWTYSIVPKSDYISEDMTIENVGTLAENYKSVKEIKSDIDGHTKLEVVVDKDKMMESLNASQAAGSDADFKLTEDLTMYVYVKDGYISRLVIDFTDAMNVADSESLTTYSMTFTISNYNKVDKIEVPEDIKEKAEYVDFVDILDEE